MPGLGPILQKRLACHFSSLEAAWYAPDRDLQSVDGVGAKLVEAIAAQRYHFQAFLEIAQKYTYITPADVTYPRVLYEIPDPPPVLYYRGNLDLLSNCQSRPGVGVVGTRSPSEYGKRWTRRITNALSKSHFVIISGMADGVDREAHQSCLEVDGQTIAVLGTGVDIAYPYRNRDVYQAIIRSGLLLSEYPPGTPPDRVNFPRRNRIIAGLSRAILVTEAPRKSGALITAYLANEYGRDVFVLPGSLDNPRCLGCLELLNQGAQVILGEQTVIDALGTIPIDSEAAENTARAPQLEPHLMVVWQTISDEGRSLDQIMQQLHTQSTGDILSALTHLELMGLVVSTPGTQHYYRCPD